jgi:hypothetical protein
VAESHGYIKLSRKMFDGHDLLWDEDTSAFDVRSAWVWLLQAAAWKDGPYVSGFGSDQLKRGEFVGSLRYLGIRWRWGKWKVARFLAQLEKAQRITRQRTGHHGTVYLIVNYDSYQGGIPKDRTAERTENRTVTGQSPDKVEEGKEGKERTTSYPADFELIWNARPKRSGSDNKQAAYKAYQARIADGVAFDAMYEGVKRYRAYLTATGKEGTEYVKMLSTLLGPDRHFADDWIVPTAAPAVAPEARKVAGVIPISRGPIQW